MNDVEINREVVCRSIGYNNRSMPDSISSLIDPEIAKAHNLLKPAYIYTSKRIKDISAPMILLDDLIKFKSKTLSYVLSDCILILIFIVTIGKEIDNQIVNLSEKGEVLKAYILDTIGSIAVKTLADKFQTDMERIAYQNGYQETLRYSPGYCDWNIKQQKEVFQAIDAGSIGVVLTESCFMIPQKSISGVIGISERGRKKPSPCIVCSKKASCPYSRNGL